MHNLANVHNCRHQKPRAHYWGLGAVSSLWSCNPKAQVRLKTAGLLPSLRGRHTALLHFLFAPKAWPPRAPQACTCTLICRGNPGYILMIVNQWLSCPVQSFKASLNVNISSHCFLGGKLQKYWIFKCFLWPVNFAHCTTFIFMFLSGFVVWVHFQQWRMKVTVCPVHQALSSRGRPPVGSVASVDADMMALGVQSW